MGTTLDVRVEAETRAAALAASERVLASITAAESRLSTWTDGSELARLLSAPVGEEVRISVGLADDLDAARLCQRLTGGAFDPAVGPLVSAWGLREGGRHPSDAQLRRALSVVGTQGLRWQRSDSDDTTATRLTADARLDEGGFGKGAGLDDALAGLAADPAVQRAELDFGGQLAIYRRAVSPEAGNAAASDAHPVAIAHPDDRSRIVARFTIPGGSVATTGNGERGIVVDGETLGHVLDPRTGRPASDFGSLTVWVDPTRFRPSRDLSRNASARNVPATFADCLSTGLYVLGPGAALDWAENAPGVEVVVAERVATDAGIRIRASSGLSGRLVVAPVAAGDPASGSDTSSVSDTESRDDSAQTTAGR